MVGGQIIPRELLKSLNFLRWSSQIAHFLLLGTVFPRILEHATIYETATFFKRIFGLVYSGMLQNIRGLEHAPLSETY